MILGAYSQIIYALLFLLGNSGDFQDYIGVEDYWENQGLEITVGNMMQVLNGPAEPSAELNALVLELGADRFAAREAAEKKLAAAGAAARTALENAQGHRDPEIKQRAKALLEKLPAADGSSVSERQRMALLTLSRMKDADAAELLKKHPAEVPPKVKDKLSRKERLSRFPEDTHLLLQMETADSPGGVVREIRNSPLLQEKLREIWMKTGDIRIDRLTFSLNGEMLRMSGAGLGVVWIEGRFEPEKLADLLDEAGLDPKEENRVWTRDGLIVALHPNHQEVFVLFNPDGSITYEELEDHAEILVEKGDHGRVLPEALRDQIPEEDSQPPLWAVAKMPGAGLPGLPSKLKKIGLSLHREEASILSRLTADFADEEGAAAVKALIDGQISEIKEEIARESFPGKESYEKILEEMTFSRSGPTLQLQTPVTDSMRITMVRQMEQMLGMIQQMHQRHEQRIMEQQLQNIE